MMTDGDVRAMIAALEVGGDYRVLRRHRPPQPLSSPPVGTRRAIFADVETTGLDPDTDEIIELALVPFFYTPDGRVVGVGEPFSALRQPARPIPVEVTRLTGIDDAAVAGRVINPAEVAAFVGSSLVVAHNAAFDRRFLERFCASFSENPWACSMCEVRWGDEGFESSKLAYLAMSSGFFYDGHRAVHDCHASIELLARPLPSTGNSALSVLLASARTATLRCWAENSPFEAKDLLKRRGYRWNGDNNGQPRAWWTDVTQADLQAERAFLLSEVYRRDFELRTAAIDAYNRYSDRIVPGA